MHSNKHNKVNNVETTKCPQIGGITTEYKNNIRERTSSIEKCPQLDNTIIQENCEDTIIPVRERTSSIEKCPQLDNTIIQENCEDTIIPVRKRTQSVGKYNSTYESNSDKLETTNNLSNTNTDPITPKRERTRSVGKYDSIINSTYVTNDEDKVIKTKKIKNNNMSKSTIDARKQILERYTTGSTTEYKPRDENINKDENKDENININKDLKSPVVSFMGHVDAGKTSLMDLIRGTKIQQGEAGGITQTIGSSFVPIKYIREVTKSIKGKFAVEPNIPGILIVDTPGHSAFSSMRDRGSSLCDIAILVIDINKGIQPQTEESIKMLKEKKVPFVIAATKIDMIHGWKKTSETNFRKVIKEQDETTTCIFQSMLEDMKYEFSKLDLDAVFYFNNQKPSATYSIVPISTQTGEGISDLLSLLVYISQNWMSGKIKYKEELDATIMESVQDPKLGWALDVILSNGTISIGDKIVVTTQDGIKVSTIRNIFTPPPLAQDRHKVTWVSNKSIRASQGIRIIGSNLELCIAGSSIFKIDNNEKEIIEKANNEYNKFWKSFEWDTSGIYLVAPTIGELDAGYNILKTESLPIIRGEISIFSKKVADKYSALIQDEKFKENKVILYFHSNPITGKQEEEFKNICKDVQITFLHSTVIYHLVDEYKKLKETFLNERKKANSESGKAIFPCELDILKDHVYLKGGADDLLFGVKVKAGRLMKGTPITTTSKVYLGRVTSIQKNNKELDEAKVRDEVCIRIKNEDKIGFGRHFTHSDKLISKITRESIDELKTNFRDDMDKHDWNLIIDHISKLNIKKNSN
jgi:translation initiation factor 5B